MSYSLTVYTCPYAAYPLPIELEAVAAHYLGSPRSPSLPQVSSMNRVPGLSYS